MCAKIILISIATNSYSAYIYNPNKALRALLGCDYPTSMLFTVKHTARKARLVIRCVIYCEHEPCHANTQ